MDLRHRLARIILLAFSVFMLSASGVRSAGVNSYQFGIVPQFEPRKLASIWKPILDQLELRTGLEFKLTGSAAIPAFERAFLSGRFDFAYMNPYHAMLAARDGAYQPLIRDGGRRLFGILVVRKDDPIKHVAFLALAETRPRWRLLDRIPMEKIVEASSDDYKILSGWGLEQYYEKVP